MKKNNWQLLSWLTFVSWTFQISYKLMSNTCYMFLPLIFFSFFIATVKLLQILRLLQKLLLNNYYSNVFRQTQQKKSLVKIVDHKPEEAFSDGIRDVQLGRFILLSVRISHQTPRLTSLSFFSLLNRPLKHGCTFGWQHSGGFEQSTTPES